MIRKSKRKRTNERTSLSGLRAAKLSNRPIIDSCLIFFALSPAILYSELSQLLSF
jgi:hypothetical protein